MAQDSLKLSKQQQLAVDSEARAIVVLANAGSGKTETIARRVLRLLEESSSADRILALSYTNKAADELRERLHDRVGSLAEQVVTDTLHGFAHSLVRQHGTRIGLPLEPELLTRDEDRVELFVRWRASEGLPPVDEPRERLQAIDIARAKLEANADVGEWRLALASLAGLDFPGLLDAAIQLLEIKSVRRQIERTYSNIIVDEAQNLTPAQFQFLNSLANDGSEGMSMMLVGDDKQSIVSFAGADPTLMRRFAQEQRAEVIYLQGNFRSARTLDELGARIATNLDHVSPATGEHAADGAVIFREAADEDAEGALVASWIIDLLQNGMPPEAIAEGESTRVLPKDIAVLGRSVAALRGTRSRLEAADISFEVATSSGEWLEGPGGKLLMEIVALNGSPDHISTRWRLGRLLDASEEELGSHEDVAAAIRDSDISYIRPFERLVSCVTVEDAVSGFLAMDGPGDTETTAVAASWTSDLREVEAAWEDFIATFDRAQQNWLNFGQFCSRRQSQMLRDGVQLMTVHKAQGREYKAVAIVGMNDGQIPDFRARDRDSKLAELRTFYVAATRARRLLLLTRPKSRTTRFGPRRAEPSPYLTFLPEEGRSGT